jgi:hypothetical protein|tara:strand:+ start:1587 stop:2309 length:723 start_codon:yes stop_codon:yes gene_type:complete
MAISITQHHPIKENVFGEKTIMLSRNGNHQYWLGNDKTMKMPSVTGITKYADAGSFGAGVGWATKTIRANDGDLNSPRGLSQQSIETGTALHDAIDNFITNKTINEDSFLFTKWLEDFGKDKTWLASEQLLYIPELSVGGTVDALYFDPDDKSENGSIVLADWKTKEKASFEQYGASTKDFIQVAAYCVGLRAMQSIYSPDSAKIVYVFRDGSGIEVVDVDIEKYWEIFKACHKLHSLLK